jgi:methylenetetrahydrofolate dehydrogenase (NADP+)/methenyltetrahydrofolate cyclohydrolase
MKLLNGRDVADYMKVRHAGMVRACARPPQLAIVRAGSHEATDLYIRAKIAYGRDIGVPVEVHNETAASLPGRLHDLGRDPGVTGVIIQLPLAGSELTDQALAAVPPSKDVDGLTPNSPFEAATPKAVLWLLAAYNVDVTGRVVIVGQGRLVGKPLADRLEAAGREVTRCDARTANLAAVTRTADLLVTATGQRHLVTADMVKNGAVVVDTGSPEPELAPELYDRQDLTLTPNPGGVGPMTVASLFDNLVIAAQEQGR